MDGPSFQFQSMSERLRLHFHPIPSFQLAPTPACPMPLAHFPGWQGEVASPTEITMFCVASVTKQAPRASACGGVHWRRRRRRNKVTCAAVACHKRLPHAGVVATGAARGAPGRMNFSCPVSQSHTMSRDALAWGYLPRRAGSGGWAMRRTDSATGLGSNISLPYGRSDRRKWQLDPGEANGSRCESLI